MKLATMTGGVLVIQGAAMWICAALARSGGAGAGVVAVAGTALVLFLLGMSAKILSVGEAMTLAGLSALGGVMEFEGLGFAIYPGLVKDLEPFTREHVVATTSLVLVAAGVYCAVVAFAIFMRRLASKRLPR